MKTYILKFDGACKQNPGQGASAAIIYEKNNNQTVIIDKTAEYFSHTTNNIAEYNALLIGLKKAVKLGIKNIEIYGDSMLVIKQIKGEYKIKNERLKEIYSSILTILSKFDTFSIDHVYRNNNVDADALANLCVLLKNDIP